MLVKRFNNSIPITMRKKISEQIVGAVESYRHASKKLKTVTAETSRGKRAYHMMMDRAAGALDVLYTLDPENPAWASTGWIN